MHQYRNDPQNGSTLVVTVLVLVILSILGTAALTMTNTELLIARNMKLNSKAFYNAEAGVNFALSKIQNDLCEENITLSDLQNSTDLNSRYISSKPSPFHFVYPSNIEKYHNQYCFTSMGKESDQGDAKSNIKICFDIEYIYDEAFRKGIVSEGDININGAPDIQGSLHANGNINQNGNGEINGNVTAFGMVDHESYVDASKYIVKSGAEKMDVPTITNEYFEKAKKDSDIVYKGSSITLDSDIQGKNIFIEGDVTIKNKVKISNNTQIVATGNITFKGESSFEELKPPSDEGFEINTAIIAGGNIIFNGSGNTYGVFWCNGDFTRNGSNLVHGSIVAAEGVKDPDVTFNGVFDFKYFEDINGNLDLPKKTCIKSITSWKNLNTL